MKVYATRVLGIGDVASEKELRRLVQVGLLAEDTFEPVPGALAAVLAANTKPKPEGSDKYFDGGRLTHLPVNPAVRLQILEQLAERLVPAGEVLAERDINLLLRTVTADIPTLRRALVDHGLLTRNSNGSEYTRP
nr:DUF2087 domain-containing protein [Arthrobacter silviterrae]